MDSKKIFVLDTNVILHDYKSIFSFAENDIIIPIVVLEELDKFKKGNDLIHYHAREFMRELDKITGDEIRKEGISLGNERGLLFIETGKPFSDEMRESFTEHKPDHQILAIAIFYQKQFPNRKIVLVSQDINLRMKAKSLGVQAQDYKTGKVQDLDVLHKDISTFDNFDDSLIEKLYREKKLSLEEMNLQSELSANEYFILKGTNSSALAYYNPFLREVEKVSKNRAYGIEPRNAEQTFALDSLFRNDIKLIALTGKAGTGKTLLALAAALEQIKDFTQIFLARPIIPLANREMGFLPGDAKEKTIPYMQPLFDNLAVIKHRFNEHSKDFQRIEEMVKTEKLLITPLAYIRGRSLSNVYFIVDEAQNLTPHEIKTIITRAGEGTKMIFTGDIHQIDSPYLDSKSNGLSYLVDRMKGQNIFAHINLLRGERSYLADIASDLL